MDVVDEMGLKERLYTFPDVPVTVCVVSTPNGFHGVGYSVCRDGEERDPVKGERIARFRALERVYTSAKG